MSLTSSLFSGVTGLNAQGNVLGILGDNISNLSTTGFKAGQALFSSLVTGDIQQGGGAGVSGFNRPQIDGQGLVQNTGIATDIAISGSGFFVVSDQSGVGEGDTLYTRAGSFRQDARGNFVNASGFFLQAWPLDNEGRLPGEIGNLNTTSSQLIESLITVNTRDISGLAFASTEIDLGLNLDAEEPVLRGSGDTLEPVAASLNADAAADDILVPSGLTAVDDGTATLRPTGITADSPDNDIIRIYFPDRNENIDFLYGGFSQSVDITAIAGGIYGATSPDQTWDDTTYAASIASAEFEILVNGETYTFAFGTPSVSSDGTRFFNSLQSMADAIDATVELTARVVNNQLVVSAADARNAVTWTDVSGTIVADAVAGTGNGLSGVGAATPGEFDTTITAAGPSVNRWNTMQGLANIINEDFSDDLVASIGSPTNDSQLSIFAADPLERIEFINPHPDGNNAALYGAGQNQYVNTASAIGGNYGNFIEEFGLTRGALIAGAYPGGEAAAPANDPIAYAANIFDPIYAAIPASGSTSANIASGEISPAFSRNIRIFDSLGVGHDVRISFVKVANNTWAVETYMANPDEIISSLPDGLVAYGTVEFNGDGSLRNVSSSLTQPISVTWTNDALAQEFTINFGTQGEPAGTIGAAQIGLTDGLSQFAGEYTVQFAEQNGSSSGLLSSLEIDKEGFVIANFSNGQSRQVYKIPIASFPSPNGLAAITGNVFQQTDTSGEFTLNEAGTGGVGVIAARALENANVELADELTDLIIAQRAFQANTKVITTADELLDELNRI